MRRPTSVLVFGILNMVFAVFGAFGMIVSIVLFFAPVTSSNPVIKIIQENPGYATFLKASIPLGFLSSAVLLASGIGLILVKNWARVASIAYGAYAIVWGIIGTVMNYMCITRPLLEQASQRPGPEMAGAIGGAIGSAIGGCIGLVYPILLIIFMVRPHVVAAFEAASGTGSV
jgi:hypothetical protein